MKSSLYVEQGYIVHTHHSPTCYEKEYVLECHSRSYGCSMISRLVWMNLDTQDTCNIKQIPSPDWHTRYVQHKTSHPQYVTFDTHIYNFTIIYWMLPSQVRIPSQHQLGETLYKTPTWGSIEPILWTDSTPSCNQWWSAIDLCYQPGPPGIDTLKNFHINPAIGAF